MNPYCRWAGLVVRTTSAPWDPATLALWGKHVGASVSTLYARCSAAGLSTRASRDLARLLRLLVRAQRKTTGWDPAADLDTVDPRTIRGLLAKGGLSDWPEGSAPPQFEAFLNRQQLIRHDAALATLTDEWHRSVEAPDRV